MGSHHNRNAIVNSQDPLHSTARPVILVGMHRSGTSLTANLLNQMGISMGSTFFPKDFANPRGYYEDVEFLHFHQTAFNTVLRSYAHGHPDWGWTPNRQIASNDLRNWTEKAKSLIARRGERFIHWGFKDPRSAPVLDFWHPLLDNPIYVVVYRDPVRVADSIQRLKAPVFLNHPQYAWAIWEFYNRRIFDFVVRHREQCIVMNIDALTKSVDFLPNTLQQRFQFESNAEDLTAQIAAEQLQQQSVSEQRDRLSRHVWNTCESLYGQLEEIADLPSSHRTDPIEKQAPFWSWESRKSEDTLSVIIPTHNDAAWLVEAISSVEQHYPGRFEVLVVDDGTTDQGSLDILNRIRDTGLAIPRIPASGLSAARNHLIAKAKGRYIIPLDSDNRILPDFLDRAIAELDCDPQTSVVYGDRQFFGLRNDVDQVPRVSANEMIDQNQLDACALFRKSMWESLGGYDTNVKCLEDWEFWLHAIRQGFHFKRLPILSIEYRVREGSLSRSGSLRKHVRQIRKVVWSKHPELLVQLAPPWIRATLFGTSQDSMAVSADAIRNSWFLKSYWNARWIGVTLRRIHTKLLGEFRRFTKRKSR